MIHPTFRFFGVSLCLALASCGPAEAPPDVVKTQREALEKARDVARDALKQDQESRVRIDDASK